MYFWLRPATAKAARITNDKTSKVNVKQSGRLRRLDGCSRSYNRDAMKALTEYIAKSLWITRRSLWWTNRHGNRVTLEFKRCKR